MLVRSFVCFNEWIGAASKLNRTKLNWTSKLKFCCFFLRIPMFDERHGYYASDSLKCLRRSHSVLQQKWVLSGNHFRVTIWWGQSSWSNQQIWYAFAEREPFHLRCIARNGTHTKSWFVVLGVIEWENDDISYSSVQRVCHKMSDFLNPTA